MKRCKWCNIKNQTYVNYHDNEWCKLNTNEKYLFEMLILESFQAGLSWECVLNKRDYFKEAYDNFDIDKIINYDNKKINELINNQNIIRNKLKIAEKDPIEIYVDGSSIVLKKIEETCVFCGSTKNVKKYKDKLVCDKCIKSIVKLSETDED